MYLQHQPLILLAVTTVTPFSPLIAIPSCWHHPAQEQHCIHAVALHTRIHSRLNLPCSSSSWFVHHWEWTIGTAPWVCLSLQHGWLVLVRVQPFKPLHATYVLAAAFVCKPFSQFYALPSCLHHIGAALRKCIYIVHVKPFKLMLSMHLTCTPLLRANERNYDHHNIQA